MPCVDLDPAVTDADLRSLYETRAAGEPTRTRLRCAAANPCAAAGSKPSQTSRRQPPRAFFICRADRTYLVTGGLTGVGLRVAEHLVDRGARHLVLLGRRTPAAPALQAIASMQGRGAVVTVVNADVADREALARLINRLDLPLGGVVHSAGALDDGVLLHQGWKRFQTVMAAKVIGAWHLHELTR